MNDNGGRLIVVRKDTEPDQVAVYDADGKLLGTVSKDDLNPLASVTPPGAPAAVPPVEPAPVDPAAVAKAIRKAQAVGQVRDQAESTALGQAVVTIQKAAADAAAGRISAAGLELIRMQAAHQAAASIRHHRAELDARRRRR
jgi:hypothetical protein